MTPALILPCNGEATRLGMVTPKCLLPVDGYRLLIDFALIGAKAAGLRVAYIVASPEKVKTIAKALGPSRHGLKLQYVQTQKDDPESDAGSVYRGYRRALMADRFAKFVVAFPDCAYPENAFTELVKMPVPAAIHWTQDGTDERNYGALSVMGEAEMSRLRRLTLSLLSSQHDAQNVFNQLLKAEIEASGSKWFNDMRFERLWNIDTIEDYAEALKG